MYGNVVEGGENAANANAEENIEAEPNQPNNQLSIGEDLAVVAEEPSEPTPAEQSSAANPEPQTNTVAERPSGWRVRNAIDAVARRNISDGASANPFTVHSRRSTSTRRGENPFARAREGIELRLSGERPPSRYGQRNVANMNAPPRRDLDTSLSSLTRLFDESTNSLLSSTRALMQDLVHTSRVNRRRHLNVDTSAATATTNVVATTETENATVTASPAEPTETPNNAQTGSNPPIDDSEPQL